MFTAVVPAPVDFLKVPVPLLLKAAAPLKTLSIDKSFWQSQVPLFVIDPPVPTRICPPVQVVVPPVLRTRASSESSMNPLMDMPPLAFVIPAPIIVVRWPLPPHVVRPDTLIVSVPWRTHRRGTAWSSRSHRRC